MRDTQNRLAHPARQINFRYEIDPATSVELHYEMDRPALLTEGFIHFPPGCNALVQVRLLLARGNTRKQVTPMDNQLIALDASDYPFMLGHKVDRKDIVVFEIRNYDEDNSHTLTCLITREELEERIHEITEGEKSRRKKHG